MDALAALGAEEARKVQKPVVDSESCINLARSLYGLEVDLQSLKDLDSYDDRNFYFRAVAARSICSDADGNEASGGRHYVFKVHNGVESAEPAFIEAQNMAMGLVRSGSGVWCPRALPSTRGESIERALLPIAEAVGGSARAELAIRCLPFRPGRLLGDVSCPSAALLTDLGRVAARVAASLAPLTHPAVVRPTFIWDLKHAPAVRPLLRHVPPERRAAISGVLDEFDAEVLPRSSELRVQTIHNDLNDQNVIVDEAADTVAGVIDFGDMCQTWLVNELAICAAYIAIARFYPRAAPGSAPADMAAVPPTADEVRAVRASIDELVAGFDAELPLSDVEKSVLPTLIASRVAVSLTVGAYSCSLDPTNEYLQLTAIPGWRALQALRLDSR